jgi:hypothetical protein
MFDHHHYVPVLRGRQGEYGALEQAAEPVRSTMTPLLEIPPIPWDFEQEAPAKSVEAHVAGIGERIARSWGAERRIFLDAGLLASEDLIEGRHPLAIVLTEARQLDLACLPVAGLARGADYERAVAEAISADGRGACLRLESEDLEEPDDLPEALRTALEALGLAAEEVDLILDLGPIFAEQRWTAATARLILAAVPDPEIWRSLTLLASSFPLDLSALEGDSIGLLPRAEWTIWRALYARRERLARMPSFGDYAISHPAPREVDPRLIQRSASIRYTTDEEFLIVKGRSIRLHGPEQHYDLSARLLARPEFHGEDFSWGDSYIAARARREPGPGNGSTWRKAGTSQHLAFLTSQIASLRDA